jgi:thiamine biosynthesis lipoprotein
MMTSLSRRRFLTISAAAVAAGPVAASTTRYWSGTALGARASISLSHPDADRIVGLVRAEIDRLEDIFSLYRADSVLARLNRDGAFDAPPFELVECLGIAGAVHNATQGAFDPSVQPLWAAYAEAYANGSAPDEAVLSRARESVGWPLVSFSPAMVRFTRPGMALTLNGIAQGYIADRVARLLEAEGLRDILVDTGEFRAVGGMPDGSDWRVNLTNGEVVALRDRALATSAPLGTVFDASGVIGHILDPRSGRPAPVANRSISVTSASAALADALSTGLCVLEGDDVARALEAFRDCRILG